MLFVLITLHNLILQSRNISILNLLTYLALSKIRWLSIFDIKLIIVACIILIIVVRGRNVLLFDIGAVAKSLVLIGTYYLMLILICCSTANHRPIVLVLLAFVLVERG